MFLVAKLQALSFTFFGWPSNLNFHYYYFFFFFLGGGDIIESNLYSKHARLYSLDWIFCCKNVIRILT